MRKVRVKICGITREEDLAVAVAAGADAVGFIVGVSSPRNISLKKAGKLIRLVPIFVKSVLVMVPTSVDELLKTYEKLSPDAVQIHGESLPDASTLREELPNTPLIIAIAANSINALEVASGASKSFDAVLLDSLAHGRHGGTGMVHDWNLSKRVKHVIHPKPLILAGGLNPENVKDAVNTVQPYAVDVCTGVEAHPGIKDPDKVLAFIENAKEVGILDD